MSPIFPTQSYWDPAPRYSISSGKLPPGLKLDSVTGAISGTPNVKHMKGYQPGRDHLAFQVEVRAKNIKDVCTTTLTICVETPLTAPSGMSYLPDVTERIIKLVVGIRVTPWGPVIEESGFPTPTFKISSPQQDSVVQVLEAAKTSIGSDALGPKIISECIAKISSAFNVMQEAHTRASKASDLAHDATLGDTDFPNLTTCDLDHLRKQVEDLEAVQLREASAQEYEKAAKAKVGFLICCHMIIVPNFDLLALL